MRIRYPIPGDVYRSRIYPDQTCRVVDVTDAIVTFEWLGQFSDVEKQQAPVLTFDRDFTHEIN